VNDRDTYVSRRISPLTPILRCARGDIVEDELFLFITTAIVLVGLVFNRAAGNVRSIAMSTSAERARSRKDLYHYKEDWFYMGYTYSTAQ